MKLNARIDKIIKKLRDYALDHPNATPEDIANHYTNKSPGDFIEYIRSELWKDRKGIEHKTFEHYQYCLGLIEKHWPGINNGYEELTDDNLRQFEYALRIGGLGRTTIKHALTTLRKYTKRAFRQSHIKSNPFDDFKIGSQQDSEKEWTDIDEIERLKKLWTNKSDIPERLHSTLIHYLHSCHCGLRAIDSRRFQTNEHIKNGFISIVLSKTSNISNVPVRIPINDYAAKLHTEIDNYRLKQHHWRISKNLKEICDLAKIEKHITFHCARHSFAINSLIKGVRIEVVSKWLGHRKLTTTQIYAKVVDSLSGAEMVKWNKNRSISIKLTELGLEGKFNSKVEAIEFIKSKLV